jgi:hypothetical protein
MISTTCWKRTAVGKIFPWARRQKASNWALKVVIDIIVLLSLIFPPLSNVNKYVYSNPLYMCICIQKTRSISTNLPPDSWLYWQLHFVNHASHASKHGSAATYISAFIATSCANGCVVGNKLAGTYPQCPARTRSGWIQLKSI